MFDSYVRRMREASTAAERKAIVDELCRMYGVSQGKAYKCLKEAGWQSGRRKRKDAGVSAVSKDDLLLIASVLKNSIRKNGKATMSVPVARSILQANGIGLTLADSRLRELLVENGLSAAEARVPAPHRTMRTLHPNQVHQADPSVALIWFAPGGVQKLYDADEVYKNKNPREGKMKCWRYVLTDHTSGSICVRYYAAMGESAVNMYDFLLYAWGQKKNPLYVFHGLPDLLVWDCGTGNTAKAVTAALTALKVDTQPHLPGNPRAKGQVEVSNNIVETQFESRLALEPVHSMEELNEAVERWCAAYNANMIDGQDTRITRHGKKIASRTELWQRILPEQLRELPDPVICRQIFTAGIQVRRVAGDLSISIVHPKVKESLRYSLHGLAGVMVGMSVNVQPLLVSEKPLVTVFFTHDGEAVSYEIEPIEYDEYGFDVTAPITGKSYKAAGYTEREKTAQVLTALAQKEGNVPFAAVTGGKGFAAHSIIDAQSPFIRQSVGTQVEVDTVSVHDILISGVEAAKRLNARLGYVPDGFLSRMETEFHNQVPARLVDEFAADYQITAQTRIG